MENKSVNVEIGSKEADAKFYIKITENGPYLVYGNPPLDQEIITPNEEGNSWVYVKGGSYSTDKNPTALCRCGCTKNVPYCDGSHVHAKWNPKETAGFIPLLDEADTFEGPTMVLSDNKKYCAFARFCDAYGRIWNLVQEAENEDERDIVKHEAGHCPSGRLVVWDGESDVPFEPEFSPSLGLIEDPQIKVSGPIWVKGGIRIESADGKSYQIRNRVTLCRCGQSSNKPFCDGTHASSHYSDKLPNKNSSEEW